MRKMVSMVIAMIMFLMAAGVVVAAEGEGVVIRKIKKIEPQMKWSSMVTPQLLVVAGSLIPDCSGNNLVFYEDELMIMNVAIEAMKAGIAVRISYAPAGYDGRHSYIPSIRRDVGCRIVGIGLAIP